MQKAIEAYIDSHREDIIEDWRALVNLEGRADEPEAMDAVAAHLLEVFSAAGVNCRLERPHPEAPQVLVGEIGTGRPGKPVLFGGHYDTVFKKGTFGPSPFRIDEEGKAHGPGCLDMKGGIIIALYVIKALEAAGYNERPLRVILCGDEEGGVHHAATGPLFHQMAEGCACALNMETGPINNSLCVGRKGAMMGTFIVHGVSAHSGNNFEAGRNAIVEAAHKMLALDAMTDLEKGTAMNVAIVNGGKLWSQIPDYCKVDFSCRFAKASEMEHVMKEIETLMATTRIDGTTTEYHPGGSGGVFEQNDTNMALWAFCNQVSQELGLGEMGHVFLGGGSDAVQMSSVGTPTLCSCGVLGEWNHTDREYAVVESMFTRAKLWCGVVQKLNAFQCP